MADGPPASPALHDAHNHLHESRLDEVRHAALDILRERGLRRMVVNGTSPDDWESVRQLADEVPEVLPSFGVHPWHANASLADDWETQLLAQLDRRAAVVGEIGLDRWIEGFDFETQQEVFRRQLGIARRRRLPVSIHCLRAWGRLQEMLAEAALPECGFLLHSYGGPAEMVTRFLDLGAYFSISGYFAHPRKANHAETFRSAIPPDRLLIETDAPDMWPPDEWNEFPMMEGAKGQRCNHPANLVSVYRFVAELRRVSIDKLAAQVEENFVRLFGKGG